MSSPATHIILPKLRPINPKRQRLIHNTLPPYTINPIDLEPSQATGQSQSISLVAPLWQPYCKHLLEPQRSVMNALDNIICRSPGIRTRIILQDLQCG